MEALHASLLQPPKLYYLPPPLVATYFKTKYPGCNQLWNESSTMQGNCVIGFWHHRLAWQWWGKLLLAGQARAGGKNQIGLHPCQLKCNWSSHMLFS